MLTSSGSDKGHQWRINRALVNNYTTIPPLMGLRKDHKPDLDGDPSKGPKLRPLCPANISPNSALGNLMSNIVRGLADERQEKLKTEVISTEEMKYHINITNSKINQRIINTHPATLRPRREKNIPPIQDLSSTVVLSMDVSALYPSISQELCVRTLTKAIKESKIPWNNVDKDRLSRYTIRVSLKNFV